MHQERELKEIVCVLEQLQMLFISECDMVEGSCDTDAIRQITKLHNCCQSLKPVHM